MSVYRFSDAFYFELYDGDIIWPTTIKGDFRISDGGKGHNILDIGERSVSEVDMIDGVLKFGKVSRFRSKTYEPRIKYANHFFTTSPSVKSIYVKKGVEYLRWLPIS